MLTPDLRKYLDGLKGLSVVPTDEKIREVLLGAGWNDESIGDALRFFHESKGQSSINPSPSGFLLDNTIPQKNGLGQISIPASVTGIDFIEETDSVLTGEDEKSAVIKRNVAVPPVSLQSTADAGHSSQSVLYPDNSSRLGMGGQSMIQPSSVSVPDKIKSEPEEKPKEGPPLMDLDTLASQVPNDEVIEKTIEEVPGNRESSISAQVQKPVSPNSEHFKQSQLGNRFSAQVKMVPSVDGVRPFARQQIQNPTRPVFVPPVKKVNPVTVKMPDVRLPEPVVMDKDDRLKEVVPPAVPVARKERSSRRFVTRVGLIAIFLGVLAATAYAYMTGLGPFGSSGPYQQMSFASDVVRGIASMKTAVVTASYDLSFVERGEKTKPLPVLASGATTTLSYFFPGLSLPVFIEPDAHFGLELSGVFRKDDTQSEGPDFSIDTKGLYGGAGENIAGQVELLRISTTTYFQIKKTPDLSLLKTLFGDISKIEGSWVNTQSVELNESIIKRWVGAVGEFVDQVGKEVVLNSVAQAIDQENIISFAKSPEAVDSWKGSATRYTLAFDFTSLAAAMRRMANDGLTSREGPYATFASTFMKIASALERPDAAPLLAYLSDNALMTIDVSDDGTPLAVAFTSRMAPSSENEAFTNKELKALFTATLTDVTQVSRLVVPTEVLSFEQALQKMMNVTEDEYLLSVQLERVSTIAQAIDTFTKVVGKLPASLDELLKTGGSFSLDEKVTEDSYTVLREQYKNRAFLPFIPVDATTGDPFFYGLGVTGDDYNLAYEVRLPPLREEALLYMSPWAYQFLTAETKPKGNGYAWRIVNGENTLNKKMFSVEGKIYR